MLSCSLQLSFFKINFQVCQTVWNQTRHDILSELIWVQTVCQSYQHTGTMFKRSPLGEKVVTRGKRVKEDSNPNDKYVLSERTLRTMKFDTSIIKIGSKMGKLWAFKEFNMANI